MGKRTPDWLRRLLYDLFTAVFDYSRAGILLLANHCQADFWWNLALHALMLYIRSGGLDRLLLGSLESYFIEFKALL